MAESSASQGSGSIDWNTDDDLEIDAKCSSPNLINPGQAFNCMEAKRSSCIISVKLIHQFTKMGFPEGMVIKAIKEKGEKNKEDIVDAILSYMEVKNASKEKGECSRVQERRFTCDISDIGSHPADEEKNDEFTQKENTILCLVDMGYKAKDISAALDKYGVDIPLEELVDFLDATQIAKDQLDEPYPDEETGSCSYPEENTDEEDRNDNKYSDLIGMGYTTEEVTNAIARCGADTPIHDLIEFISAAQIARAEDAEMDQLDRYDKLKRFSNIEDRFSDIETIDKKRKFQRNQVMKDKRPRQYERISKRVEDDGILHLPNPMIGFGVPSNKFPKLKRSIPDGAKSAPYFYYENVALTPKGVWKTISSFLHEIEPEFVDSKFFCAAARKRGYIHNLPLENRFPLLPLAPKTIFEALPGYQDWWPWWDPRTQLNCLLTCVGSAPLADRIKSSIESSDNGDDPPLSVKKFVIEQCKKWNMVWVGKNRVAPLEPEEMELIMGFPKNHTRGYPRTDRYKCLGNTFQVDTVAYHLSVLKSQFPQGMNVLSLFSGIGGAEVALHRLGIHLNNVVSVEKSSVCQKILQSWWDQTDQKGNLIHVSDVKDVTSEKLRRWMDEFGGFDLVIGGSPCNNLAGGNRRSRDGLEGEHSSLFFDYFRILDIVRRMTKSQN